MFYCIYVFLFLKMSDSLIPSFLMSDVRKSLRLLTKNERFAQKTNERIPSPALPVPL